jgi:hypothetical protein
MKITLPPHDLQKLAAHAVTGQIPNLLAWLLDCFTLQLAEKAGVYVSSVCQKFASRVIASCARRSGLTRPEFASDLDGERCIAMCLEGRGAVKEAREGRSAVWELTSRGHQLGRMNSNRQDDEQ